MGKSATQFEGDPLPLPMPMMRGKALYARVDGAPVEVRHAQGYELFAAFVEARGRDPFELGRNIAALIDFIQENSAAFAANQALTTSATRFLGNAIAQLRGDAKWRTFEVGSPTVGDHSKQFSVEVLLIRMISGDTALGQQIAEMILEWGQENSEADETLTPQPVLTDTPSNLYVRPALPAMTFTDSTGAAIPYGHRWTAGGPRDDSYSFESNLQRFAPLHMIAEALIEHLQREYAVTTGGKDADAADWMIAPGTILRSVQVTPSRIDAATLTFVFTSHPGAVVRAGALHDFYFPVCGCDACDETAESEAERLEHLVMAVAAGGYAERYPVGPRRWSKYALTWADRSGSEGGEGDVGHIPKERLQKAAARLHSLPNGWQAWPPRHS